MTHVARRILIASALAAIAAFGFAPIGLAQGGRPRPPAAPDVPTPRTADGHPDLSGLWGGRGGGGGGPKPDENGNLKVLTKQRPCTRTQVAFGACEPAVNFERDSGLQQRLGPMPMYKPEFWEQVQRMDRDGSGEDPITVCKPEGVPRVGPPTRIVQTPMELVMLYQSGNAFREVPIDGRPHDPIRSVDTTWNGDPVGHWEGDTLVIDIVGFTDESWLGWPGWIHSNNMHVVEKYTRKGNTLLWQATVEDPDMLLEPFVMEERTVRLNPNQKTMLTEDLPCDERDIKHIVTKERG